LTARDEPRLARAVAGQRQALGCSHDAVPQVLLRAWQPASQTSGQPDSQTDGDTLHRFVNKSPLAQVATQEHGHVIVPPHPSAVAPQSKLGLHVLGVQHWPPTTPTPLGQQTPNTAFPRLAVGFAQLRLQQLTFVAHCWPFGLQPPARASRAVLTRSAVLATSARRAMRQSDFASDMGGVPPGADAGAHQVPESTGGAWKSL
jgi:hypothetical protein